MHSSSRAHWTFLR